MYSKEEAKEGIKKLIEKYWKIEAEGKIKQFNEEQTKKTFIEPLFSYLGWDISDHEEVFAEEAISTKRTDYIFKINGIAKFVLEAKPLKANLNREDYALQTVNYAWLKACGWGVLTDFEGIKVFNALWKAKNFEDQRFLTLSLNDYIDKFDDLWLLSKESFLNNKINEMAERYGKLKRRPVTEQLFNDLMQWRLILSKNISKINKLSEEDLDESVQRILDRLVFIRVCEDRSIEPDSLLQEFRSWQSNKKGKTLMEIISKKFREFDSLYNSKLFARHLCEDLKIDEEILEEIIDGLYGNKEKGYYDFAEIDADILGNIYEQYLGHILRKTTKGAKLSAEKQHRKEMGIYYTPTYIVDYIVKNTVEEKIKECGKLDDIEKIKILDPTCGSGSFLIKAFDVVLNKYKENLPKEKHDKLWAIKNQILTENIFGVDLDPKAVEIAQLNLLLKAVEKRHLLPSMTDNIKCGDSLIENSLDYKKNFVWKKEFGKIMSNGGFDIIIGNPPYVTIGGKEDANVNKALKKYYSSQFLSYEYKANYFILFIEKCLSILNEGGVFSFIVPRTLLDNYHMKKSREIILNKSKILKLIELKYKVFKEVETGGNLIFVLQKSKSKEEILRNSISCCSIHEERRLQDIDYIQIGQKEFFAKEDFRFTILDNKTKEIIDKIERNSHKLGEICYINNGVNTGNAAKILLSKEKLDVRYRKILEGKDVDRYQISWGGLWICYDFSLKKKIDLSKLETRQQKIDFSLRNEELFNAEKIILRQTSDRLIGAFDNNKFISRHSTHILRTKQKIPLKYILGIFNSKLLTFYYQILIPEKGKTFAEVKTVNLEKLPIRIDESYFEKMIKLVDTISYLNEKLNNFKNKITDETTKLEEQIKQTDKEIDELVYKLYGITEEEKKIIEGA